MTNSVLFSDDVRRITDENNDTWWVAKDVCLKLGLTNSRRALMTLDDDEKSKAKFQTKGGLQTLAVVSEPGLYSLIFKSRKPEAIKFQDWVCEEVLPSIRKHGFYMTPDALQKSIEDPEYLEEVVKKLMEIKEEKGGNSASSKGCYDLLP